MEINQEFWPAGLCPDENGFSNNQLENLVSVPSPRKERFRFSSPWVFSPSEVYGNGRAFREISGWPDWLPIAFSSDHAINLSDYFSPYDTRSAARSFLTWSEWRVGLVSKGSSKSVRHCMHPWVGFRRKRGIELSHRRAGILVFIPHALPWGDYIGVDWDEYFHHLLSLVGESNEISLLVHANDIQKDLHHELRRFGFPIFTLGSPDSPFFVDRFYDLVRNFQFGTSREWSSALGFAEELGVGCFIFGRKYQFEGKRPDEVPPRAKLEHRIRYVESLFQHYPPRPSWEKEQFVRAALGLAVSLSETRSLVRRLLVRDPLLVLPGLLRQLIDVAKKNPRKLTKWLRNA